MKTNETIKKHGAWAVYRAACDYMSGNKAQYAALGLPAPKDLGDVNRVMSDAFELLSSDERMADNTDAQIELKRVEMRGRPRRGAGTVARSVTLQASAWEVVDARAEQEGRSSSSALEQIVNEWAKAQKGS